MKTLSEDRRALHRIPETGCRLPETAAYLRGALAEMPCTLLAPWEDAVCAYFDLGKDETVAVRSDMDALPVTERTGLPFASAHPGRMHACGHDGHMAMVLGLARRLAAGEVRPQRNVLLIFEPAEETTVDPFITSKAREVIAGKWGNGQARKDALAAWFTKAVQDEVNRILGG